MKRTKQLGLYQLEKGDYAEHWHIPTNANAQAIEDEVVDIRAGLLASPEESTFTGSSLSGTMGSLEARLNAGLSESGEIIFNNNDLDKSRVQKDGFETTSISDRLSNVDRREFVNARLRYLQVKTSTGSAIKKMNAHNVSSTIERTRYATEFGMDFGSNYFNFHGDFTAPEYNINELNINKLGWFSLGGKLFYHENPVVFSGLTSGTYIIKFAQEPLEEEDSVEIDTRLIRDHTSYSLGSALQDTNEFQAGGIGSSNAGNNDWQPKPFQILRIKTSELMFKEYLIKEVSLNSVAIHGKFEQSYPGNQWWILDYTQPCVIASIYEETLNNIKEFMTTQFTKNNLCLNVLCATIDTTVPSMYWHKLSLNFNLTREHSPHTRFVDCTSLIFTKYPPGDDPAIYYQALVPISAENNASSYNIKSISVVCLEAWKQGMSGTPDLKYQYVHEINPPNLQVSHIKGIHKSHVPTVPSMLSDAENTISIIRIKYPDDPIDHPWTSPLTAYVEFRGRLWWGLIIEYI